RSIPKGGAHPHFGIDRGLKRLPSPFQSIITMLRSTRFLLIGSAAALMLAGCTDIADTKRAAPAASAPRYNVRDFGATGDRTSKDTKAFQKALDTCAVNGGGEVLVPAGKYLIGSIQIGNRTTLRLEKDSVLAGTPDIA